MANRRPKLDKCNTVFTILTVLAPRPNDRCSGSPEHAFYPTMALDFQDYCRRKEEAARTFDRIVQEFPQSSYLSEAQRERDAAKKS